MLYAVSDEIVPSLQLMGSCRGVPLLCLILFLSSPGGTQEGNGLGTIASPDVLMLLFSLPLVSSFGLLVSSPDVGMLLVLSLSVSSLDVWIPLLYSVLVK